MGKPVNLNRVRKDKARAEKKARADSNALKFGRTKVERSLEKAREYKAVRDIDGHKLNK